MASRDAYTSRRWWLRRSDGSRQRLTAACLLIGRSLDCHVLLLDPRVSAHHALLTLGQAGPRLLTLGRTPPIIDGSPAERVQDLTDGAVLHFPGESLTLCSSGAEDAPTVSWGIERASGIVMRPAQRSVVIGGGEDDIVIPGWAHAALACHTVRDAVIAIPRVAIDVRGQRIEPLQMVRLVDRDRVEIAGEGFTFVVLSWDSPSATVAPSEMPFATCIRFQFLPNGGRLQLDFPGASTSLRLSELRCRLVAALLGGHRAFPAGAPIADDDLVRLIWPNQLDRTHVHLNQVIHRLREELLTAGVNPLQVIVRDRIGPCTWFRLGPGTRVELD